MGYWLAEATPEEVASASMTSSYGQRLLHHPIWGTDAALEQIGLRIQCFVVHLKELPRILHGR